MKRVRLFYASITFVLCSLILFPRGHLYAQKFPSLLTLDQACQLARAHNRDLKTLRLHSALAIEKTAEAKSKAYPQISSFFGYTTHAYDIGHTDPATKNESIGADRHTYNAGLAIEQSLFHSGIWAGIRVAENYRKMEALAKERYFQTLDYLVTKSYIDILRAQKEEGVLKELETNTQEHLRDTDNFYHEGIVEKTDLLKTELMLSQVERDLVRIKNQQKKLWSSFKILLGSNPGDPCQITDIQFTEARCAFEQKNLSELHSEALATRKDILRSESEKAYLENIIAAYRSKHYPTLSAFGSWDYTSNTYDLRHDNITGGIRLTIPLFSGFGINAEVDQARTQLAEQQLRSEELREEIKQEVESAYLDFFEAQANIKTAEKEVEQAEENLRINKDLYKESMTTNTDVLDAQTLLAKARNNWNSACYDRILAIRKISLAVGKENLF